MNIINIILEIIGAGTVLFIIAIVLVAYGEPEKALWGEERYNVK